jgi:branched-chain amino acid transport system permease protein
MIELAGPLLLGAAGLGAAYALMALGFVVVINAAGAVNFAHGHLVLAGGFAAIALAQWLPLPGLLLLPVVALALGALGLAVAALGYFPLRDRPEVSVFVATIALGILIEESLRVGFGPAPQRGPALLGDPAAQTPLLVLVAVFAVAATWGLLFRTGFGRRLRATAADAETARALGVPVNAMIAAAFALGAALAGLAGLLLAPGFLMSPSDGGDFMLKAYIATVIGGWGSLGGALAGALLIALFEVFGALLIGQIGAELALYACVFAVLMLRPSGLFGERGGRRA